MDAFLDSYVGWMHKSPCQFQVAVYRQSLLWLSSINTNTTLKKTKQIKNFMLTHWSNTRTLNKEQIPKPDICSSVVKKRQKHPNTVKPLQIPCKRHIQTIFQISDFGKLLAPSTVSWISASKTIYIKINRTCGNLRSNKNYNIGLEKV